MSPLDSLWQDLRYGARGFRRNPTFRGGRERRRPAGGRDQPEAVDDAVRRTPDVIGRVIILDNAPYTIVAIMPPRFAWHVADVWVPRAIDRRDDQDRTARRWFQAHLKPGVTLQPAEAQLGVIAAQRAGSHPTEYPPQYHVDVIYVVDFVTGGFRGILYALFAAVSLLLLIACCNVAIACYWPARRAVQVDPLIALRRE